MIVRLTLPLDALLKVETPDGENVVRLFIKTRGDQAADCTVRDADTYEAFGSARGVTRGQLRVGAPGILIVSGQA